MADAAKPLPTALPRGAPRTAAAKQPQAPSVKTLIKTMNILKGGLYSKDDEVVTSCAAALTAVVTELNLCGGFIVGQTWDWFSSKSIYRHTRSHTFGTGSSSAISP